MSNNAYTDTDPLAIKPIVEALIFASEEPLSPRALIKLLAGENARPSDRVPPLLRMIDEASNAESPREKPDPEGAPIEEPTIDEPPVEEPPAQTPEIDEPPIEEPPVEEPSIDDPPVEEPPGPMPRIDGGEMVVEGSSIDHARRGGITLVLDDADDETISTAGEASQLADAIAGAKRRTSGRSAAIDPDTLDQRYIRRVIDELNDEYDQTNRAFRIVEVAGGFQYATMREYGEYVALLSKEKSRRRLSAAALETLAIIAYRQPVSKPEIEAIRGVNCDQVLLNLMEKNLVFISGRSEGVGRALLYGSTDDFLRSFGLNNIADLPKLREIEELMETDALSAESIEVVMIDQETDVEEIEAKVGAMGSMHRPGQMDAGEMDDGKPIDDGERMDDGELVEQHDNTIEEEGQ